MRPVRSRRAAESPVGLLVNPMAGRDIRRLVALAPSASGPAKVLAVRRLIRGVRAVGPLPVVMVDDPEGLAFQVAREEPDITILSGPVRLTGDALTGAWVERLQGVGVRVLISVGGDGTQRAVAKTGTDLFVLPVAGGTNNVSCWSGEDTLAGMAAARVALARAPRSAIRRVKRLRITPAGGLPDLALVDAAHVATPFTGALAVYRGELVSTLVLTIADATRPGLSNLGGFLDPVSADDDWALVVRLGRRGLLAPAILAPGLVEQVRVAGVERIALGQPVTLMMAKASTVAVDGERTITLKAGQSVEICPERTGPLFIDPVQAVAGWRPRRRPAP